MGLENFETEGWLLSAECDALITMSNPHLVFITAILKKKMHQQQHFN